MQKKDLNINAYNRRRIKAHLQSEITEAHEASETTSRLPEPGDRVNGRYIIERKLGQGQFGWVFLVRHVLLDQRFAMKIMHPRIASDERWVQRFREEARLTSLLGHEYIVFVTDFDHCDRSGYYFVMEYLEGTPLSSLLKSAQQYFDPRWALSMTLKIASALNAVHELGIVHRDLKPSNVMIVRREDGTEIPKILDFGIASNVVEAVTTHKLYGTPAYMAPEQTRTMEVDARADQFSLACILYEMLTGQRAWKTRKWTDARLRRRQHHLPAAPSELRQHKLITPEVDAVLMRAMALDPDLRFASLEDFGFALRAAANLELKPTSDPIDSPTHAFVSAHISAENGIPMPAEPEGLGAQDSLVVLVQKQSDINAPRAPERSSSLMQISLSFRTQARLQREWKRNLQSGTLFVPHYGMLPMGKRVRVQLVFEPEQLAITLDGEVCSIQHDTRQTSAGFGVRLDDASNDRARSLMLRLGLMVQLQNDDVVRPLRQMHHDDALTTGEAFLMSRLFEPTTIQDMRSLFSGLPFVFDEVVTSLDAKGLLSISSAHTSSQFADENSEGFDSEESFFADELDEDPNEAINPLDMTRQPLLMSSRMDKSTGGHYLYDNEEVEQVLELVEYFKRTHNYLGAIHVLRKALDVSPTVGEFYRQLALLHAKFRQDMDKAFRAIECAIQLEPSNRSFQQTNEYLRTLHKRPNSRPSV